MLDEVSPPRLGDHARAAQDRAPQREHANGCVTCGNLEVITREPLCAPCLARIERSAAWGVQAFQVYLSRGPYGYVRWATWHPNPWCPPALALHP
jgi:hypothetical protein